jgi:hypothetical protein
MLAVKVLVQAIVVTRSILQQQWRRPDLAGGVAATEKRVVAFGIADIDP